jgi:hypothetical protein
MTFRSSLQTTPLPPDSPLEVHRMDSTRLDHAKFRQILARSEPLVVTSVQYVMQGKWNPTYFVRRYGSQEVTITDCESDHEYSSTVAQFFSGFGTQKPGTNNRVLKLKAMPPFFVHCPKLTRSLRRIGLRRTTLRMSFLSCMRRLLTAYHFRITHAPTESIISQPTFPLTVLSQISVSGGACH